MKLNEKIVIYGTRVILVPYDKEHVEKYHGWMQSKDILEATASEPLSIEQEYKMQESWRDDDDKLTFIVLSAQDIEDGHGEIDSMIGKFTTFFVNFLPIINNYSFEFGISNFKILKWYINVMFT